MDRLTDRKTAAALKKNADGLKENGIEPNISDLRYIKLAEYENAAEHIEIVTNAPALSYQAAMIKHLMDGCAVKCKVNIVDKPTKTIIDETAVYKLDDEPKDETKLAKNNPSINVDGKSVKEMIMRRFMERR